MTELNLQVVTMETATLGMGCFWGPDSRFGHLPGVIRTRVGYAGGTSADPTYRNIGDHTETIEIDFDPSRLSYETILTIFWQNHNAIKDRHFKERQYLSLLLYHNEKQQAIAQRVKAEQEHETGKKIQTEFQPYTAFYRAEERHQKYFLNRFPKALETILPLFSDYTTFVDSTIAARLNGFVREFGTLADIKAEISQWGLDPNSYSILETALTNIKW